MFHSIDPKDLKENVFSMIGDQWMLVTAGTAEKCSTMTASWGGLGFIWDFPAATCYIRPQRYTKEFLDRQEYFTLSFFGEEHRDVLAYCGSKSGRDVDKVKECGLTVRTADCGAPYFEEARLVLVCRERFAQEMHAPCIDAEIREKHYMKRDYHTIYIGEIVQVLSK